MRTCETVLCGGGSATVDSRQPVRRSEIISTAQSGQIPFHQTGGRREGLGSVSVCPMAVVVRPRSLRRSQVPVRASVPAMGGRGLGTRQDPVRSPKTEQPAVLPRTGSQAGLVAQEKTPVLQGSATGCEAVQPGRVPKRRLEQTADSPRRVQVSRTGGAKSGAVDRENARIDPELAEVIEAWDTLPPAIRFPSGPNLTLMTGHDSPQSLLRDTGSIRSAFPKYLYMPFACSSGSA